MRLRYPRGRFRLYFLSVEPDFWVYCGLCADGAGVRIHSNMHMALYWLYYASESRCGSSCERDRHPEGRCLNGHKFDDTIVR
jgi:hypothetical protein